VIENRVMPKSILIEGSVIAGMIQEETYFWAALENLTEEHFTVTDYKKCFVAMRDTKSHDYIMIDNLLQNSETSAPEFFNCSFSVTGETEFSELQKMLICRKGILACYSALNAYYSPDEFDPVITTSTLSKSVSELSTMRVERTKIIGDMLPQEMDRQKRIATGGTTAFIKTGVSDLDKKLCIEQSDYIIIGARPSNGKSSLAGAIGRNVCRSGGVVYVFYLDTAKEVEVSRAVFSEAKISLSDFNSGFIRKADCPSIGRAIETLTPMKYYLDDTPRITPDQIRAKCQRLISIEGKIDLVIVDFLQNVRAPINNTRERVSHISDELHNLPREIGCPVIALSQMARYQNEEKESPTLKVLKESGDIEEDADKVLLLYYPEHYKYVREESDKKNLMEVFIAKNKNGSVGYVPLNFFASTFEITNRSTSNGF